MSSDEQDTTIKFIPKKRKPLRKRKHSDEEDEDDVDTREKIEEMKTLQKLRERPNGVSVITLALGEKISKEEETLLTDPFKVKTGGLVNMSSLKSGKFKQEDDAYDTGIGTQFSAETNKRDEDEEMMKYIEEQLSKRKGQAEANDGNDKGKYCSPEEAALLALPEHLRASSSSHRSEEMLSNQMLSGIPEVDLGIESKIRNIEATEEAKLRLLRERKNKQDGPSQFVPTNMAVNFVQHNRFSIKDPVKERWEAQPAKAADPEASSEGGNKKNRGEKATDDYHYEKFKKQFRRY